MHIRALTGGRRSNCWRGKVLAEQLSPCFALRKAHGGNHPFFKTASPARKVSCSPHRFRTYCPAITAGGLDVLLWNNMLYSKVKTEGCMTQNYLLLMCFLALFFFLRQILHPPSATTWFPNSFNLTVTQQKSTVPCPTHNSSITQSTGSKLCSLSNQQHAHSSTLQQLHRPQGSVLHRLCIIHLFTFKPPPPHMSDLLHIATPSLTMGSTPSIQLTVPTYCLATLVSVSRTRGHTFLGSTYT